ncbi:DnaJ domain-containing protein [bacterium]|nr:DnaJ domain-containing protein [bacterium]
MPNLYELLGVSPDADEHEIKSAFRRMARQCHPDRDHSVDDSRFIEIKKAYDTLSSSESRKSYDHQLRKHKLHNTISDYSGRSNRIQHHDLFEQESGFFDQILQTFFQQRRYSSFSRKPEYRHQIIEELTFRPRPEYSTPEYELFQQLIDDVLSLLRYRNWFY